MSRHILFPKDEHSHYTVVVGWDRGLQTFFLQYGDVLSDLPLDFATGQRPFEHPGTGIIMRLAAHLAFEVPADLANRLEVDREAEGFEDPIDHPHDIQFTTQADDGRELAFVVSRQRFSDPGYAAKIADYIIEGHAERALSEQVGRC